MLTAVVVLFSMHLTSVDVNAQNHETDWALFSKALINAVESSNYGAKLGAIQQIAIYGSRLDVDPTVFDVVRVFRNSKVENERILALSALAKMRNHWAMDFLSRSVRFETSDRVKRHTIDVVNAYRLGTDRSPNDRLGITAHSTGAGESGRAAGAKISSRFEVRGSRSEVRGPTPPRSFRVVLFQGSSCSLVRGRLFDVRRSTFDV